MKKTTVTNDSLAALLKYDPPAPINMKLISVYDNLLASLPILYTLLEQSPPETNISHKTMPTHEDHINFVLSRPYLGWYVILDESTIVGSIYLSKLGEFGVRIAQDFWNGSYEVEAIKRVAKLHPLPRYLINFAPGVNRVKEAVILLLKDHIQDTFELRLP